MDRYIDCLLDNDLQQLIIDITKAGAVKPEQLQAAWDKVYVQSLELQSHGTYNEMFELLKEINDLRAKITIVNNTVQHLQLSYDKELVDILNVLALRCDVIETDFGEVLIVKLNRVIARMKKWFLQLSTAEKQLEKVRAENTNGKLDRGYFDNIFEVMSENKGYQVEAGRITVSRFYRSLIRMNQQAEAAQLKLEAYGR